MSLSIGLIDGTTTMKKLRPFKVYPDTPATEIEFTDTNSGNSYTGHISNVELTLIETIKALKLKNGDLIKLVSAINEYGSEKYSDGGFNATYEG